MADEFHYAQTAAAISDAVSRAVDPKFTPLVQMVAGLFTFRDHDLEDFLNHLSSGCGCTDDRFNTAVGSPLTLPLISAGTGIGNVALGTTTLVAVSAGNFNTALGAGSGGVGDFSDSTGVGFGSLNNNSGDDNVAVGYNSGGTDTADRAVAVGSTAQSHGDDSVAVGYASAVGGGVGLTPGGIAVGSGTRVTADNAVAVGKGILADQPGSIFLGVDSTGTPATNPLVPVSDLCVLGTSLTALAVGDPGSGSGQWKLGKVQAAAAALDATQYVEVMIDGVVVKLAVVV